MFFRSLVTLLALLALAGGCTSANQSPTTVAAAAQSGPLPREIAVGKLRALGAGAALARAQLRG